MKYLQNVETKEIVPFTDDAFAALNSATRKKGFREVNALRIKHKSDGRTALIAKSEYDKFGKPEKDEWELEQDPEVLARSILADAIEQGTGEGSKTEGSGDADPNDQGGENGHADDEQEEDNGDPK